jgi:lipoprotein-anchoring transpeptidase ErfK/SrfK
MPFHLDCVKIVLAPLAARGCKSASGFGTSFGIFDMRRRDLVLGSLASLMLGKEAVAAKKKKFELDSIYVPQVVQFPGDYEAGTIIVDTSNRFLFLQETSGTARRYGIGVGKTGLAFTGTATVGRKAKWPSWRPTASMIKRSPKKYAKYADGLPGGPQNPLGSRALYLFRDGRDTLYRIHGTIEPWTIGKAVSNGCVRMINEHVEDLYERVPVGATVIVI